MLNALIKTDLFKNLEPSALREVLAAATLQQRWPAGRYLFQQGEPAEACYVLLSGQVHLAHLDAHGHEVILCVVEPGHALGITALLEEGVYATSAWLARESTGLVWPRSEIQRLARRHPTILNNALQIAMTRYAELQQAYQRLAFETVDKRLASALVRLAHANQPEPDGSIIVRGTREQLAMLAVTTVPTTSRLLSEWERHGWVTSSRMTVIIKNLAALEAIARGQLPNS
jgi:CRP-like cAMP-binding protein